MADPKTRAEVIAISGAVADEFSIPRALLLGCLIAESNLVWNSRRPTDPSQDAGYWPDVSGGVGQQTVKYDPDYHGGGAYPGSSEVARVLELQYDVKRSAQVAAANLKGKWNGQTDDASLLSTMARYNWPGGSGAFYSPAHEANYRRGLTEAHAILGVTLVPTYDPTTPIVTQNHDWDCAEQSTLWAMTAFGRHPSDAWMEGQMLADGIESADQGLLDGSGGALARWITAQYGEFGYSAYNVASASFDDVRRVAGTSPVLLGGHGWGSAGHWSGVRRYDDQQGTLVLANPGGTGPVYGQTSLDRSQFAGIGPCSMVVVTHESQVPPVPTPPAPADPRDAEIAQLRAQVESLRADLAEKNSRLGVASVDYVKNIRDVATAIEALKP